MVSAQHIRGAIAEDIAAAALIRAGWRIVGRNVRVDGLEIDIVARDEIGRFVAVEVRARTQLGGATPLEVLGPRKVAALRRQREAIEEITRVDLLLVIGSLQAPRLRLVRGVAEPQTGWRGGGRISWPPDWWPVALVTEYARGTCRLATVAPRGRDGVPRWHNRIEEHYGRSYDARTSRGWRPLRAPNSALESEDGAFHLRPTQRDSHP